jgi:drug/metabolite transporter (DMT)-like permease
VAGALTAAHVTARRELLVGVFCAVAIVAIWCGFILISRVSVGSRSLLPTDLAALRFGVAAAVMLPALLWRARRLHSFGAAMGGMTPRQILVVAVFAGLGFGLFAFSAFAFAPVAHAGVLMPGALPFSAALVAWLVLRERVGGMRAIGLTLIFAGIVTIGYGSFTADRRMLIGDALFLCASSSWAVFVVFARKWQIRPVEATIALAVGAALIYLPIYALFLPKKIAVAPLWEVIGQGAYQGLVSVVASTLIYTRMLASFGPTRSAMITAVVPGLAAVLAVPLLGEPLAATAVIGLLFVTIGMIVGVARMR